jgi:hypothetical protein
MNQQQLSARSKQEARAVTSHAPASSGDPPRPPPNTDLGADAFAERALNEARVGRIRSLLSLAVLVLTGVGAVSAGILAHSQAFWAAAAPTFLLALSGVVAYAAGKVGVVEDTVRLVRVALKGEGDSLQSKPSRPGRRRPMSRFAWVRIFTRRGW